jgi:hypothetical protein
LCARQGISTEHRFVDDRFRNIAEKPQAKSELVLVGGMQTKVQQQVLG